MERNYPVGINIRSSILDLEEEIAHHVKYQTCHFFRTSKFSNFFHQFFSMNNRPNSRPNHCKPMSVKSGHFYEPIRTINHFGQSDFRVLCHLTFLRTPSIYNRLSLLQLINTQKSFYIFIIRTHIIFFVVQQSCLLLS